MEIYEVNKRPILNINVDEANPIEKFQNQSLRPILKMLNYNLIENFHKELLDKKIDLSPLSLVEKTTKCKTFLQNDLVFKNILLGMVIGQFTETETAFYLANRKEISKRIYQMAIQRIISQLV